MRHKRSKVRPQSDLRDNSKSISVRMTEEQFQRLESYRNLTRLPVTTYFRKLIAGSEIYERPGKEISQLHAESNMIYSNIRQILRTPRAKALDQETAGKIGFLLEKVVEHTSHICAHHDLNWRGEW